MEITAPGGTLEKIKYAVAYGADAVYCAYQKFGLRAFAGNLTQDDLQSGISFCHEHNAKLYLTLNIYARNADFAELTELVQWLSQSGVDALIISDPGVFNIARKHSEIPIHISTQANITNMHTARFWFDMGAKRIIPARELCLAELIQIKEEVPELEVETFIHGAMCIAWSGRCLLSAALNKRSANQGECTHPCRWNWALTEESRPDEYFPVQEDEYGTYILSSKDLCLLPHVQQLAASGIDSGKIEGRMKSLYYVAQLARLYKSALSIPANDTGKWTKLMSEICKVSHRQYYHGFFYDFDQAQMDDSIVDITQAQGTYERDWQYCAKITQQDAMGIVWFDCFSKISLGEEIEIIFPDLDNDIIHTVTTILDTEVNAVQATKPNKVYGIPLAKHCPEYGIIRKAL